jgi:glycosyltransferase involved in cell wall biosynthesis
MKIALVLPAEGSQNLGNTMICESTERLLRRISFIGEVERFSFLRRPSHEELERLNQCDLAIFVGTNIFQPHVLGWEWQPEDWRQVHIPYWLYGVGYSGPLKNDPQEICPPMVELISWAAGAEGLGVRDPQTVRWLSSFYIDSELIGCPVLAYADSFSQITPGEGRPVLAVREILLHSPGEEAQAAQRVMIDWFFEKYPDGVAIAQEPADLKLLEGRPILTRFEDIIEALAQARFVFTARLHAGMIALSFGRPAVFLAHDTRVASFCEMIGLPMRELSFAGLAESIKAIHTIERGDLDEFQESVPQILCFRQRLEEFLKASLQISPRGRERLLSTLIRLQAHLQQLRAGRAQLQAKGRELSELRAQLQAKDRELSELQAQLQAKDRELSELQVQLQARDHQLSELQSQLQARDRELSELRQTLTQIYSSLGWMMLQQAWGFVEWALPPGTRRRSLLVRALRAIKVLLQEGFGGLWRRLRQRLRSPQEVSQPSQALQAQDQGLDLLQIPPKAKSPGDKLSLMVVIPTMGAGGMERCAEVLLKNFNRETFELELMQIFDRKPFYHIPEDITVYILERYRQPQVSGAIAHSFPEMQSRYSDELAWLEATAYKLALLIRRRQPDIILAQDFYASAIVLIAKQYLPEQFKIIGSLHNQYSHFLQTVEHGDLYAAMIRRYFNQADRIIAVSQGIAQDLSENFGVRPELIAVIPNPVDLDQIRTLAEEPITEHCWFSEELPICLFVGRLSAQKGVEYLLQAMALARPLKKFRCVIIGDGEKRSELEALVKQLKLTEDIAFLGRQSNPFKFMHRATCFVLPSIVEGLPYVIPEAMACGCPIIATDCAPGVRELLGGGERGLLVPPKDPTALAEALLKALSNSELRQALQERGLQYVQEFSAEKIVKQYEELIQTVLTQQ